MGGVPTRMSISKLMSVAYVQILLGVTRHQVMAHGMHCGMLFEHITSLFVQIRTCNNLAPGYPTPRKVGTWMIGIDLIVWL